MCTEKAGKSVAKTWPPGVCSVDVCGTWRQSHAIKRRSRPREHSSRTRRCACDPAFHCQKRATRKCTLLRVCSRHTCVSNSRPTGHGFNWRPHTHDQRRTPARTPKQAAGNPSVDAPPRTTHTLYAHFTLRGTRRQDRTRSHAVDHTAAAVSTLSRASMTGTETLLGVTTAPRFRSARSDCSSRSTASGETGPLCTHGEGRAPALHPDRAGAI